MNETCDRPGFCRAERESVILARSEAPSGTGTALP
jgi:hypothetical protein